MLLKVLANQTMIYQKFAINILYQSVTMANLNTPADRHHALAGYRLQRLAAQAAMVAVVEEVAILVPEPSETMTGQRLSVMRTRSLAAYVKILHDMLIEYE